MAFCTKCGKQLAAGQKFCTYCGQQVSVVMATPPQPPTPNVAPPPPPMQSVAPPPPVQRTVAPPPPPMQQTVIPPAPPQAAVLPPAPPVAIAPPQPPMQQTAPPPPPTQSATPPPPPVAKTVAKAASAATSMVRGFDIMASNTKGEWVASSWQPTLSASSTSLVTKVKSFFTPQHKLAYAWFLLPVLTTVVTIATYIIHSISKLFS